jgi:hypothetical protein
MAKFVSTKDDSLGGKVLDNGKVLVARKIDGRKVVEVLDETADIIDKALPLAQHIIQALINFFNDIFQRFPHVIVVDGVNHVFTIQPARGIKANDRVFYQSTDDANDVLFFKEAPTMGQAKKQLFQELKSKGYV